MHKWNRKKLGYPVSNILILNIWFLHPNYQNTTVLSIQEINEGVYKSLYIMNCYNWLVISCIIQIFLLIEYFHVDLASNSGWHSIYVCLVLQSRKVTDTNTDVLSSRVLHEANLDLKILFVFNPKPNPSRGKQKSLTLNT